MKSIFAIHGIPEIVYSDNGPCYSADTFMKFAAEYGFVHHTSSPKMPQSNGLAERSVRTIKIMLKQAGDPYLALLLHRTTLLHNGYSAAEMLMGRRLNTAIPIIPACLEPKWQNLREVKGQENRYKVKQKNAYDSCHRARQQEGLTSWQPCVYPRPEQIRRSSGSICISKVIQCSYR